MAPRRGLEGRRREVKKVEQILGNVPDFEVLDRLCHPSVSHVPMEDREDEYKVTRIQMDDVLVRYVQDSWSIQLTVEGTLPPELFDVLVEDARGKLALLENSDFEARRVVA